VVKVLFERRQQGALKSMKVITLAFAYGISLDEVARKGRGAWLRARSWASW
jgi:hypothetical protein